MGIFGKLDASKVSANPYFVAAGEYTAVITKASNRYNQSKEKWQLVIEYKITEAADEDNNKYIGRRVSDWFDIFPEMTEEELADLEPEEQAHVQAAMSAVKRRLCGFSAGNKDYPGLGISEEDLDESWEPKSLVDLEVAMGVVNSGDDEEFSNIRWVTVN